MKITEPKTPYVRYDAETDTFEGGMSISIPNIYDRNYLVNLLPSRVLA